MNIWLRSWPTFLNKRFHSKFRKRIGRLGGWNQPFRRRKREQMSYRGRAQYFRRDKRERMAWWRQWLRIVVCWPRQRNRFQGFLCRWEGERPSSLRLTERSLLPPSLSLFLCFSTLFHALLSSQSRTDETFHFHSSIRSSKRNRNSSRWASFPNHRTRCRSGSGRAFIENNRRTVPGNNRGYCGGPSRHCWKCGGWGVSDNANIPSPPKF